MNPKIQKLKLLPGFRAEHLHSPSENGQGSWVAMTFDNKGRLITSDQYGWLYRMELPDPGSGDTLVVGSQNEGYDAPSQEAGPGSVFVYQRRDGAWTQEAMLRASRPQDNVLFGRAVEVSAFGNVIAVGAPYETIEVDSTMQSGAGAVYVFKKQAGAWVEQQAVNAPNPQRYDLFGWGVRLSENGRTLAVLAAEQNYMTEDLETGGWPNRNNTVYVFEARSDGWNLAAELEGSANDPHFGGTAHEAEGQSEGFDLSADGRTLAIASPFAGAEDGGAGLVRIYRRRGPHWMAAGATLTPTLSDRRSFGLRLTLSANGRTLVAFADRDDGAYGQPYVVAFDYLHHQWQQAAIFETPGPQIASGFANSLALSWSGRRLAVGDQRHLVRAVDQRHVETWRVGQQVGEGRLSSARRTIEQQPLLRRHSEPG